MTPQEAILTLNDLQKQIIHGPTVFGDIAKVISKMAEDHTKAQTTLRERTRETIGEEFASDVYRLEAERDALKVERDMARGALASRRKETEKLRGHLAFAAELLADGVNPKTCEEDAKWRLCAKGLLASVGRDRCLCDGVKEKAWHLVCGACWHKLPVEMRDEVFAALNEGEGSNRHLIAKDACMEFLWAAGVALKPLPAEEKYNMRKAVEAAPDTSNGTAWRDELLAVPTQLSPRLKWMQEHGVTTHKSDDDERPWMAMIGPLPKDSGELGPMEYDGLMRDADTEDEAIVALAKANGWRLWNEL